MTAADDEQQTAVDEFLSSPVWQQLGAVQAGTAHAVPADIWFGFGPNEAEAVLDDLEATLLGNR